LHSRVNMSRWRLLLVMASRERGRNIVAAGRTCRSPLGSAGEEGALTWFSCVEIGDPSLESEPDGCTFTIAD